MWRHHVETLTGRARGQCTVPQCTVAHRAQPQAPRASALNSRALTTQVASGASLSRRRQHAAVALMAATRRTRLVKTQLRTPRLPARPRATLTRTRCPIGWPLAWSTRAGAEGLLGRRKSTGRWGACSTVGRVVRDMAWIRLPAFRCMHVCRPGESFLHLFASPHRHSEASCGTRRRSLHRTVTHGGIGARKAATAAVRVAFLELKVRIGDKFAS